MHACMNAVVRVVGGGVGNGGCCPCPCACGCALSWEVVGSGGGGGDGGCHCRLPLSLLPFVPCCLESQRMRQDRLEVTCVVWDSMQVKAWLRLTGESMHELAKD